MANSNHQPLPVVYTQCETGSLTNDVSKEEMVFTNHLNGSLSSDVEKQEKKLDTRHKWSSKVEYILSMVGFCVGLGNVWRFPYVCIRNGGGAFLIPFLVCLTLCGLPLYVLEVSMGQFVSLSPFHVWSICPLSKGIGISMNLLCFLCSWYYSMILAWSLIFVVNSLRSPQPWTLCDQWWNTDQCLVSGTNSSLTSGTTNPSLTNSTTNPSRTNSTVNSSLCQGLNCSETFIGLGNGTTLVNASVADLASPKHVGASEEFWIRNVLRLSGGMDELGSIPWESAVSLTVSSIVVFLCIVKGIRSSGKAVYITATLPYMLLVALLVKGLTLPGAYDGILFYITPDFSKLIQLQTWVEATVQVFYSLGPVWGGLITMASYNKFHNNCVRDAIILCFVCEGTSVFAGFAIFSVLGHMAYNQQVPVANFSESGPGLVFVVYPEAISYLPAPQVWGVLFFLMLFTLGLDTQFVCCETILTTLSDIWPHMRGRSKVIFKLVFMTALLLISFPFAAEGGMYLFQLVDWYFASIAMALDAMLELVVVNWIYGSDRFLNDIKLMIGYKLPFIFVVFWKFITPAILLVMFVSTLMSYGPPTYQGYEYSASEVALGQFLSVVPLIPIPVYAVYTLFKTPGTFIERIKHNISPSNQWQPSHERLEF